MYQANSWRLKLRNQEPPDHHRFTLLFSHQVDINHQVVPPFSQRGISRSLDDAFVGSASTRRCCAMLLGKTRMERTVGDWGGLVSGGTREASDSGW